MLIEPSPYTFDLSLLGTSTFIVLQFAAAALHGYLARCFYPDREEHAELAIFMWAMVLCGLFHLTDAIFTLFVLLDWEVAASWAHMAHLFIEYSLCPFMVSSLMAEYRTLPEKPNIIARKLQWISLNARPLSYAVLVLAYGLLAARIMNTLQDGSFEEVSDSALHTDSLIIPLGLIWLLMIVSGLRPEAQSYAFKHRPVLWVRIAFVLMVVLAVSIDEISELFYNQTIQTDVVHFVTVPFAILFSWYRYRLGLVDVIAKKLGVLTVILVTVWLGLLVIPSVQASLQILCIFILVIITFLLSTKIGALLDSLWMPETDMHSTFRRDFPVAVGHCYTREQAIASTEKALSELFSAKITIHDSSETNTDNGESSDENTVLYVGEEPALRVELGYIKGYYPWFSTTRAIVSEAVLYLQNQLQVLEMRAVSHQQELNNHQLQMLAARAERDAMRAQIRPHFLFNVLNTLHSFVRDQPREAEEIIELLAELMRGVVRSSEKDTYPLQKEIELVSTYLKIEKIRHGERLSFDIKVGEGMLSHPILPFSIQPLIENAVKYSVDTQLGKAKVCLEVAQKGNQLLITVTDNGPGPQRSSADGLGFAMGNIRERLDRLYGSNASLALKAGEDGGAVAVLTMPWLDVTEEMATCPAQPNL